MTTVEEVVKALKETPYGKGIKQCPTHNDAVLELCERRTFFSLIQMEYGKPEFETLYLGVKQYRESLKC